MTKDALRRIHGCRKQHSKHKAPMQSQKAGNEPEQTESAVEDDVHNLVESFSFPRLIYRGDFMRQAGFLAG